MLRRLFLRLLPGFLRLFCTPGLAFRFPNSNCVGFNRDLLLISTNQVGLLVDVEPSQALSVFNRSGGEGESFFIGIAASNFDAVDGGEACLLSGDRAFSKRSFMLLIKAGIWLDYVVLKSQYGESGNFRGKNPRLGVGRLPKVFRNRCF